MELLDVLHEDFPVEFARVGRDVHQTSILTDEGISPRRRRVLRRGVEVVVLVCLGVCHALDGMSRKQGLITVDDGQTLGGYLD